MSECDRSQCDSGVALSRPAYICDENNAAAITARRLVGWLVEGSNGQIVGGGGIVIVDWPGYPGENHAARAWILNMYTEPGARRCGVAKRLLEVMIEWCRTKGLTVRLVKSPHLRFAGWPN